MGYEQLMYKIMGSFSRTDAPIVFKGALITKLILAENAFTLLERPTRDIDANWVGEPPTMEVLVAVVNNVLNVFEGQLIARATRVYGEKKSAGIEIVEAHTGDRVTAMDISMKPVMGSRIYYYGEATIEGVLVYALSHCVVIQSSEIFDVMYANPHRELGAFHELCHLAEDVAHAYDALKGIEGKPPFSEVYDYVMKFIAPFAKHDRHPRVWDSATQEWHVI